MVIDGIHMINWLNDGSTKLILGDLDEIDYLRGFVNKLTDIGLGRFGVCDVVYEPLISF